MCDYRVLIHGQTWAKADAYRLALRNAGQTMAGRHLQRVLTDIDLATLTTAALIEHLLATKRPQIFAETMVRGDGTDWNETELSILGDIAFAIPVSVFDDGSHRNPQVHDRPFPATLLFTPGALLRNGRGQRPADWNEVIRDGVLDPGGYRGLCERRLLPLLLYVEQEATARATQALVTIPGLGCGQFAGPFRGTLGPALKRALIDLLERHAPALPHVRALYYDPFDECNNERYELANVSLLVRPLLQGNEGKPQLCHPATYSENGNDFSTCRLFSIVAWDHVSWPGNDFYLGHRVTDDGVKAAATDAMAAITGIRGHYDPLRHAYTPPKPYRTWAELVTYRRIRLQAAGNLMVLPEDV
jgi:hypothetical protein